MFKFEISEKDWNLVSEKGLPEDGEWCFIIYKTDREPQYDFFVGGYNEEQKEFWVSFGYGGAVVDAENVVAWADFEVEADKYLSFS